MLPPVALTRCQRAQSGSGDDNVVNPASLCCRSRTQISLETVEETHGPSIVRRMWMRRGRLRRHRLRRSRPHAAGPFTSAPSRNRVTSSAPRHIPAAGSVTTPTSRPAAHPVPKCSYVYQNGNDCYQMQLQHAQPTLQLPARRSSILGAVDSNLDSGIVDGLATTEGARHRLRPHDRRRRTSTPTSPSTRPRSGRCKPSICSTPWQRNMSYRATSSRYGARRPITTRSCSRPASPASSTSTSSVRRHRPTPAAPPNLSSPTRITSTR